MNQITSPTNSKAATTRLLKLARRQYGVVTTPQLRALGIDAPTQSRWRSANRLVTIHRGVHSFGHDVLTEQGRWNAAVLAAGPGAVLSHASAAAAWSIRPQPPNTPADVTSLRQRRIVGVVTHWTRSLPPDDIASRSGIRVTSVARTLLDLGDMLTPEELAHALHEAAYARMLRPSEIERHLAQCRGRHAGAVLRKAWGAHLAGSAGVRSRLERRCLDLLRGLGIPSPLVNVRLAIDAGRWRIVPRGRRAPGGTIIEVDLFWPAQRVCVEVDGPAHGRPASRAEDARRDALLAAVDIDVVRLTVRAVAMAERRGALPAALRPYFRIGR